MTIRFALNRTCAPQLALAEFIALAARAGVQPGDVIVGVNNIALTSVEQLREHVAAAKSGDTLALRLIRDGNTLFVAVPVAEK